MIDRIFNLPKNSQAEKYLREKGFDIGDAITPDFFSEIIGASPPQEKVLIFDEFLVHLEYALSDPNVKILDTLHTMNVFCTIFGLPYPLLYDLKHMPSVLRTAIRYALYDCTILVTGESGTGKEIVAEFIHKNSPNNCKFRLEKINCSELNNDRSSSDLFGHTKGAFTGAIKDRSGLIESVGKGTILLDEIDKANPELQAKLLRLLDCGEYRKVGEDTTKKAECRFLCACSRDLSTLVNDGKFYPDLKSRISGFELKMPSLFEISNSDVVSIYNFASLVVSEYAIINRYHSDRIIQTLNKMERDTKKGTIWKGHSWEGNTRDFINYLKRNVILWESAEWGKLPKSTIHKSHTEVIDISDKPNLDEVKKRYYEYLESKNLLQKDIADIFGMNISGLRKWKNRVYK